jgi:diketogulonate reductase-like aldo/keto reductase
VLNHAPIADLAASLGVTAAQVVFSLACSIGILPLTGTSNAEHMKQDLASRDLVLPPEILNAIESLTG